MRRAFFAFAPALTSLIVSACGRSDLDDLARADAGSGGATASSSRASSSVGGAASSTSSVVTDVVSSTNVGPGFCGDGILDPGEQCDDGNFDSSDGCVGCAFAFCGDGVVEAGLEQCDDG